jgi:hypothetical protein
MYLYFFMLFVFRSYSIRGVGRFNQFLENRYFFLFTDVAISSPV